MDGREVRRDKDGQMTTQTMWMVRAGERAWRFEEFERGALVSIGWHEMGDLNPLRTRDDFVRQTERSYPDAKKAWIPGAAGQVFRFVREIKVGDSVLTYNPAERSYLVGTVTSEYEYAKQLSAEQPNLRHVKWRGRVARDQLSVATRNSLGAISTLFVVPADAAAEIEQLLAGQPLVPNTTKASEDDVDDLYKDIQAKAFEFIKDKVSELDWEDMQELVAGLLRAMGYKTRVSPSGSDRGKDIVASPDGFGFEDPRVVVEVKHRTAAMGSQEIRSFLGGRHDNDKGLYVSTGGFTREARYEAERGRIPVTLLDMDDLVKALLEHYERMDIDMQRLIPLRKLYWPV
jgi:restriction system protein